MARRAEWRRGTSIPFSGLRSLGWAELGKKGGLWLTGWAPLIPLKAPRKNPYIPKSYVSRRSGATKIYISVPKRYKGYIKNST